MKAHTAMQDYRVSTPCRDFSEKRLLNCYIYAVGALYKQWKVGRIIIVMANKNFVKFSIMYCIVLELFHIFAMQ